MSNSPKRARDLFNEAVEQVPPADWSKFLDEECGEDQTLRAHVHRLLNAHQDSDSFMEIPAAGLAPTVASAKVTEDVGTSIGPYKLMEKIGEGGFGLVFVAEQQRPVRRKVAIKVIKPGMDSREVIARFEAERQALALMDHPNIAKVLDGGSTESGRPYFVMELVKGVPINQYCDQQKLTTDGRLELFIKVCQAIQHAHQKGIIHRDIKPTNVLITLHDGAPVPRVIDFGIAKATQQHLTDKTIYTRHHQFIGTPAYMSPEQAELSGLDIDTRSDIYSLGVLLYELLTGTTPFDQKELLKSGLEGMRKIICDQEPARPSNKVANSDINVQKTTAERHSTDFARLVSVLRGDLDWIAMKCLEKDRTRRYDTAKDLASDVEKYLHDEPVTARPPSTLYRFQKSWRRNRRLYSAVGAVMASLLIGFSFSLWQAWEANAARLDADAARGRETNLRIEAEAAKGRETQLRLEAQARERVQRQNAYSADMKLAREYLRKHNHAAVQKILDRYAEQEDLKDIEWESLSKTAVGDEAFTYPHESEVRNVALSADGSRLASATVSGKTRLLDVIRGVKLQEHGGGTQAFGSAVGSVALSPNARFLASERLGTLVVRNTENEVQVLRESNMAAPICFSPDSRLLAAVSESGVRIWQTDGWSEMDLADAPPAMNSPQINAMTFTPDSCRLVFSPSRFASKLIVHNLESGSIEGELSGLESPQAVGCTDSIVAASGSDGNVCVWNLETLTVLKKFRAHRSIVLTVALSPDGSTLATGGNESEIKLWNTDNFQQIGEIKGHHSQIWDLQFSADGKHLASASMDKSVKLWDWEKEIALISAADISRRDATVHSSSMPAGSSSSSDDGRVDLTVQAPRKIHDVTPGQNIQSAVDAAEPGDHIRLAAGLFDISETIVVSKPLTIQGTPGGGPEPTILKAAEGLTYVLQVAAEISNQVEVLDMQIETAFSGIRHLSGDFTLEGCTIVIRSRHNFQKAISLEAKGADNQPTATAIIRKCNLSAEYVGDTADQDLPPDIDIVLAGGETMYKEIRVTQSELFNGIPNAISNGIETRSTTAKLTIEDNRIRCQGMSIIFPNHVGPMHVRDNDIWSRYAGIFVGTDSTEQSIVSANRITIDKQELEVSPLFVRDLIAVAEASCIRIGHTSAGVATRFFKNRAVVGRGTNFLIEHNTLVGNPKHGIALLDSSEPESYGPPTTNDSHQNVIAHNDFAGLDAEWDISLGSSTYDNLIHDNDNVDQILVEAGESDRNKIYLD